MRDIKRIVAIMLCLVFVLSSLTACKTEEYEYGIKLKDGVNYKFITSSEEEVEHKGDQNKDSYGFVDRKTITENKFDKKGNLVGRTEKIETDGESEIVEEYSFKYNSKNCPVSGTHTMYKDGKANTIELSIVCDDKKRLIELASDKKVISYTYDDMNRVSSERVSYLDQSSDECDVYTTKEYTYTEEGYSYIEKNVYEDKTSGASYMKVREEAILVRDYDGEVIEESYLLKTYEMNNQDQFSGFEITYYDDGNMKTHKSYFDGDLFRDISYTPHNNFTEYHYDDGVKTCERLTEVMDDHTEKTTCFRDGVAYKTIVKTYTDRDEIYTEVETDENGDTVKERLNEYTYDGDILRSLVITTMKRDESKEVVRYEFDEQGRSIRGCIEYNGEVDYDSVSTYENDNLVKVFTKMHSDEIEEEYFYDENNNYLGLYRTINGEKNREEKYDSYGNLLSTYSNEGEGSYREIKCAYRAYEDDGRTSIEDVIYEINDRFKSEFYEY